MKTEAIRTKDSATDGYLRREEACRYLGISLRTLNNWMKRKAIPYHKIGRVVLFRISDIQSALCRYKREAIKE